MRRLSGRRYSMQFKPKWLAAPRSQKSQAEPNKRTRLRESWFAAFVGSIICASLRPPVRSGFAAPSTYREKPSALQSRYRKKRFSKLRQRFSAMRILMKKASKSVWSAFKYAPTIRLNIGSKMVLKSKSSGKTDLETKAGRKK